MFIQKHKISRYLITICDIGFYRLCRRILYDVRRFIDSRFPWVWLFKNRKSHISIRWKENLLVPKEYLLTKNINNIYDTPSFIIFDLISDRKKLYFPIKWNNSSWSRIWQFNLHYFNWARDWVEDAIKDKSCDYSIHLLNILLDDWISNNPIGSGDGWHSYTLSLRIRNWIFLFRFIPEFASAVHLRSLWIQILWLNSHPEDCNGGNHWLENLITLSFAGIQFENEYALYIHNNAMIKLKKELKLQILDDGGHQERSASYHILLLDRLVELACIVQSVKNIRPDWLIHSIKKMTLFTNNIRLRNSNFPNFNDSPIDGCPPIDEVIEFANSYLDNRENKLNGVRNILSKCLKSDSKFCLPKSNIKTNNNKQIIDLPDTGWTIIKPNNDWELIFKCGKSCPKHLPGHSHSDLLSFDLFFKGQPIIVETGTSFYGDNTIRYYERSGAAHNVLRLRPLNNASFSDSRWIEPVDVWGNFRSGRKARIIKKDFGKDKGNNFWIIGAHDGFNRFGAHHERKIQINKVESDSLTLTVRENIECKYRMLANQIFHLGPNQKSSILNPIFNSSNNVHDMKISFKRSYYSIAFGKTIKRNMMLVSFILPRGINMFETKMSILPKFTNHY